MSEAHYTATNDPGTETEEMVQGEIYDWYEDHGNLKLIALDEPHSIPCYMLQ